MRADPLGFDILVIGAGPAGVAAAVAAAGRGKTVGVVDDNPSAGGQIWRGGSKKAATPEAAAWFDRLAASGATILTGTQVVAAIEPGVLLAEADGLAIELRYRRLILATGARERFLPFPGWTLPNVLGAGGLQAMVKSGLPIAGKRVVVAGSGPLLLAVAAYLKGQGARIPIVAEQAPGDRVVGFGLGLWREPGKLRQAIGLRWSLGSIRYRTGLWPVRAEGLGAVESVTFSDGRRPLRMACDYLACGFGLTPNVELPMALGCGIVKGFVGVDASQQTTVPEVFACGEITGIGGLDLSMIEGAIAGCAASGDLVGARERFADRERARGFARRLDRAFALRDELRDLARPETIVCRCEDVRHEALARHRSWADAKLQTRCGMGPCGGRICGDASAVLYGWARTSIRPPILPTDLGTLGGLGFEVEMDGGPGPVAMDGPEDSGRVEL